MKKRQTPKNMVPLLATRQLSFFSVGDWMSGGATNLFLRYGYKQAESVEDADILIFNGGQDIATEIYGEQSVVRGVPQTLGQRDLFEIAAYNRYKDDKTKFFFGICRGAQLLNCLNGGTLYQHVDNHQRTHNMVDLLTGTVIETTSVHHQQMRLGPNSKGEVIAVASESKLKIAEDGEHNLVPSQTMGNVMNMQDLEVVWFEEARALCIQGHPEYNPSSDFSKYCIDLLEKFHAEVIQCAA